MDAMDYLQSPRGPNRAHAGKEQIKSELIAKLDPDERDLSPRPKWSDGRRMIGTLNNSTGMRPFSITAARRLRQDSSENNFV
jgi:hypothetical protein